MVASNGMRRDIERRAEPASIPKLEPYPLHWRESRTGESDV